MGLSIILPPFKHHYDVTGSAFSCLRSASAASVRDVPRHCVMPPPYVTHQLPPPQPSSARCHDQLSGTEARGTKRAETPWPWILCN